MVLNSQLLLTFIVHKFLLTAFSSFHLGQSIPEPAKVIVDLNSTFQCAQSYVMLSRIQTIDQLYIIGSFNESTLKTSYVCTMLCSLSFTWTKVQKMQMQRKEKGFDAKTRESM